MLSTRELKVMESRLSQRRFCGGKEFGTGLVKEGLKLEKMRDRGLSDDRNHINKGLEVGKNIV